MEEIAKSLGVVWLLKVAVYTAVLVLRIWSLSALGIRAWGNPMPSHLKWKDYVWLCVSICFNWQQSIHGRQWGPRWFNDPVAHRGAATAETGDHRNTARPTDISSDDMVWESPHLNPCNLATASTTDRKCLRIQRDYEFVHIFLEIILLHLHWSNLKSRFGCCWGKRWQGLEPPSPTRLPSLGHVASSLSAPIRHCLDFGHQQF